MNESPSRTDEIPNPVVNPYVMPWRWQRWPADALVWPPLVRQAPPPLGWGRRWYLAFLAVNAVLILDTVVQLAVGAVGEGNFFSMVFIACAVGGVSLRAGLRAPRFSRFLHVLTSVVLYGALAVIGGLGLAAVVATQAFETIPMLLASVALITGYLLLERRAWRAADVRASAHLQMEDARRRADLVDGSRVSTFRTFGVPGGGLVDATARFGERNVALGTLGEQITASLLEGLLVMPGVRVVHGLRFPGSARADIDHAVLAGDRVALIDSKLWQPGLYELDRWQRILYNATMRVGYSASLGTALERMRARLRGAEVRGWIVVHPNQQGTVGVVNSFPGPMRIVTAESLLQEVGDWLAPQGHVVNRFLLHDVLAQRKF